VIILKLGGAPSLLWSTLVVFAAAAAAGARLPVARRRAEGGRQLRRQRREERRAASAVVWAPDVEQKWVGDEEDLAAFLPMADTEVLLALMPMSVLKASVGFLTFLFAFGLRREGAATWWFGLVLGALTAGTVIGVLSVRRLRRAVTEQQMLYGALWLVAAFTALGALISQRWFLAVVALAVGAASALAKPSFDALVQRYVRESNQGRAFARFETRFQLMWVVGSLVPVVLALSVSVGCLVIAIGASVGAVSYLSSRRALGDGQRDEPSPHHR
jgi:hypothetical protein